MAELLDSPSISWPRVGQLSNELGCDAFGISASLVSVIIVDMPENIGRMRYPDPLREGRDIQVVTYLITPDDQITLNAQGLIRSGHAKDLPRGQSHFNHFQRHLPDELAHPRLNVAKFPLGDLPGRDPVGDPSVGSFDRLQDGIESRGQTPQYMIMIGRGPVISPQRGRGTTYEHGIRNNFLELRRRLQNSKQLCPPEARSFHSTASIRDNGPLATIISTSSPYQI